MIEGKLLGWSSQKATYCCRYWSSIVVENGSHERQVSTKEPLATSVLPNILWRYRRMRWVTIKVQSLWRMYRPRKEYVSLKQATISIQCFWRVVRARREAARLRKEREEERRRRIEKEGREKILREEKERQRLLDLQVDKARANLMSIESAREKSTPRSARRRRRRRKREIPKVEKALPKQFTVGLMWEVAHPRRIDLDLNLLLFDRVDLLSSRCP